MKILFTCGREPGYTRNAVVLQALQSFADVTTIVDEAGSYFTRLARILPRLLLHKNYNYDLVFAGFLGHPLMPFVRSRYSGPILFDAFISLFDTLCFDRKRFTPESVPGKAAFWLDSTSTRLADRVLLDTNEHAAYFEQEFQIPHPKLASIFVGCEERYFSPRPASSSGLTVLYYGSFIPLQGIDVIIQAAASLQDVRGLNFRIIGDGMVFAPIKALAERLGLANISFLPPVPLPQLPDEIARADICLCGHFSNIPKAARVIAGKTFQCIAMGKPVVVGDNLANRELLTPDVDAIFCAMNDPAALSAAIRRLALGSKLREELGRQARQTYLARASQAVINAQLQQLVTDMVG